MVSNDDQVRALKAEEFPALLHEIPDVPGKLHLRGALPTEGNKLLAVVGSRKYSPYGKAVTEHLISSLRGAPVTIVSGLALGIDAIAHRSALLAGLQTLAVPGSGLADDVLYPRTNFNLAREILKNGGGLLSEFSDYEKARPEYFPKRNRIMAGMSHATLIIEATDRSGTLITARLAMEYNRDVCVVPGSILSGTSAGSNALMREGAFPITKSEDLLEILEIEDKEGEVDAPADISEAERKILDLLSEPITKAGLLEELEMPTTKANILLSEMEIKGLITEDLGNLRKLI